MVLVLALAGAACGQATGGTRPLPAATAATGAPPVPAQVSPVASPEAAPVNGIPAAARSLATEALRQAAERQGVDSSQVSIARSEERQWPDASLGCPQPGTLYAQVVTPGYLLVVATPSGQLEYHTDTRGKVVFCRQL